MSLLIGLDVGWSEKRRTCGVAMLGARVEEKDTVTYGDVSAVALLARDVAGVLSPAVQRALRQGQRVLIVADAIVGQHGVPQAARHVDGACSKAGFYLRAQSCSATTETGRRLYATLHEILDELLVAAETHWTPWLGDCPLPSRGVVVTETNPTTSMALALAMADRASLPTRTASRTLPDGTRVRAKSDWYWRSGAGQLAAEMLSTPAIGDERHHERVAGLWCLALARELEAFGRVALLGDEDGTYLVGSVDPSWEADVDRVGVRWGTVHRVTRGLASLDAVPKRTVELSARREPGAEGHSEDAGPSDDEALPGGVVSVRFTDLGGLSRKANPWLGSVQIPCRLRLLGKTTVEVTVTRFAPPNDRSQFKIGPTIGQLMRAWGGPSTLSGANHFEVVGEVLALPPGRRPGMESQ